MAGRRILIATGNPGKLREMGALTADLPVELASLADFPDVPEAVEDGTTFEENAVKKALHYARETGCWALADDSGLVVDALDGAPGVYSARYADGGGDAANNAKLVEALRGIPQDARSARFVCAAVLASPEKVLLTASGTFEGQIVDEPRGGHGFGYDPHFWLPERGCTSAQLPPEVKNSISHRGKAMKALCSHLTQLLAES